MKKILLILHKATTNHSPISEILEPRDYQSDFIGRFYRLAIINVLSNIIVPISGLISLSFLGHLSNIDHLAGVALATPLFNGLYFVLGFLRMGTTGVTGQTVGRNDREEMILIGLRNSLIALGLGGLVLLLQSPLEFVWFNHWMSATSDVKASGINYFDTRILGAPAVVVNLVLIGWLMGREQSGIVLLMSVVGNAANILLDYLFIIRWDWASAGAGLAQSLSQYSILLLGIMLVSREISWKEIRSATEKLWDAEAFKAAFSFNGNIFLRSLSNVAVFTLFFSLSSAMGTRTLTENALLIQVFSLSIYCFDGIGFATEALIGNFQGQKAQERLMPLLQVAISTSLLVGLSFAGTCVLFPETVLGLLTDHTDILDLLKVHVSWLLLVMGSSSVSAILDAYFAGLGQGEALRNAALMGITFGFTPIAVAAWYFHSNHILLLAIGMSMTTKAVVLAIQLFRSNELQFQPILEKIKAPLP